MANEKLPSTIARQYQWYFKSNQDVFSLEENKKWRKYSDNESAIIEQAYCSGNKLVEFDHYWINLNDNLQINKNDENDKIFIKRVGVDSPENRHDLGFFFSKRRPKPFEDSALEGGNMFIYEWKKRNATLSDSEIVEQAAKGILTEGNLIGEVHEAKRLTKMLLDTKDADENEIFKRCIHLYSINSFLYQIINEALRNNDKTKIDTLAPFCYFLMRAVWNDTLCCKQSPGVVYRGVFLESNSVHHLQQAIGEYKCWYAFTSSSRNFMVAEMFSNNVLFIIDVNCIKTLDLKLFSNFPDEEEILLPPGSTFRIDKVEYDPIKRITDIHICMIPETRIILLGRTGTGKSSLGNTILGRKQFTARKALKSITTQCEVGHRILNERRFLVVDTPGFFDTELTPEMIIPEICASYQIAAPGPDVFLIVLTFDRFTAQEEAAAIWISQVFDGRALDYCIVVFTGLDNLKSDERTLEEFLQEAPDSLKNLMHKCNNRYIAVDNRASDDEKEETLKILFGKISAMIKDNGGQYYTNKQFIQIGSVLKKYPRWFDPLKSNGTVNLLPETKEIIMPKISPMYP